MRGRKAPSVVYPGHRKGVVRESRKKKKENDTVEGWGGDERARNCVYVQIHVCAQKERERERDIGAADLNIEHARNITRSNLSSRDRERERERER